MESTFLIAADPGGEGCIYFRDYRFAHKPDTFKVIESREGLASIFEGGHHHYFADIATVFMYPGSKDYNPIWIMDSLLGFQRFPCEGVIEKVQEMPKNQGMFRFGECFMGLRCAMIARNIPFTLYRPQSWKPKMDLPSGSDKGLSCKVAAELAPALHDAFYTQRGRKLDGRADAFLLAEYHLKVLSGEVPQPNPVLPILKTETVRKERKARAKGKTTTKGKKAA